MCSLMAMTTKAKIARAKNRHFLWNVAVDTYLGNRTVNQIFFQRSCQSLKCSLTFSPESRLLVSATWKLEQRISAFLSCHKEIVLMPRTTLVPCYNYSSLWHKIHAVETAALNKSTIGVFSWREIFSVASASDVYSDRPRDKASWSLLGQRRGPGCVSEGSMSDGGNCVGGWFVSQSKDGGVCGW